MCHLYSNFVYFFVQKSTRKSHVILLKNSLMLEILYTPFEGSCDEKIDEVKSYMEHCTLQQTLTDMAHCFNFIFSGGTLQLT